MAAKDVICRGIGPSTALLYFVTGGFAIGDATAALLQTSAITGRFDLDAPLTGRFDTTAPLTGRFDDDAPLTGRID